MADFLVKQIDNDAFLLKTPVLTSCLLRQSRAYSPGMSQIQASLANHSCVSWHSGHKT